MAKGFPDYGNQANYKTLDETKMWFKNSLHTVGGGNVYTDLLIGPALIDEIIIYSSNFDDTTNAYVYLRFNDTRFAVFYPQALNLIPAYTQFYKDFEYIYLDKAEGACKGRFKEPIYANDNIDFESYVGNNTSLFVFTFFVFYREMSV